MHIITTLAIIVNIISVIFLTIGLFYKFEQPKVKAVYGYCVVGSLLMYTLSLSIAAIFGLIVKQYLYSIILFLCIISLFVIGKLVRYETLKKYTIFQIICFIVSLVTLLQSL